MNAALLKATDDLIDFIKSHESWINRDDILRFRELDEHVYLLAIRAGLHEALPQMASLTPLLNFPNLPRDVWFEGRTNLPGDWVDDTFMQISDGRWMETMLTFRKLVEVEIASVEASEATTNGTRLPDAALLADERSKRIVEDKSRCVDDRLRDLAAEDNRFYSWKSPKLGELLGVDGAAIRQTGWWKCDRKGWLAKERAECEPPDFEEL